MIQLHFRAEMEQASTLDPTSFDEEDADAPPFERARAAREDWERAFDPAARDEIELEV